MIGWIKLHRSLLDWQWYSDHNATRLLIHLLVSVNYEEKKWKGIIIKKGQLVTSWESLSLKTGLSVSELRTAIKKLETSHEISRKLTAKSQIITLVKWDELQQIENDVDRKLTAKSQGVSRELATTKETKNLKKKEVNKLLDTKVSSKVETFDFDKLLIFINETFSKEYRVINDAVKRSFKARLKDKYKKADITATILNLKKDKYHIETNYKYCTPEFISRSKIIDKYGFSSTMAKEENSEEWTQEQVIEYEIKHGIRNEAGELLR